MIHIQEGKVLGLRLLVPMKVPYHEFAIASEKAENADYQPTSIHKGGFLLRSRFCEPNFLFFNCVDLVFGLFFCSL